MASILKHLRSSTADKRPTASGLADGQIAINTASGTPAMFFKDSAGNIVKVGPAHTGTTAPNASPAGSAGNSDGELWIDESLTTRGLKYYDGATFINLTPSGTTSTVGLVELATDAETQAGTDNVRAVTPSGLQSKISDSTATTSSTTIASSTAVKSAFDLANAALPKAGGTLTGELLISPSGSLVFEGSSDDSFETTIAVTNPTADRTITFPNVTGNVVTTGDSGTVTSTMIADGTIVDADINAAAAITHSKLANITAGSVLLGNASNVPTATALSGDVTINSSGVTAISAGVIVNADINASAAIVDTKLDTISTADKVSLSALNIDGATDIGGALENGDLFVVDDGAGGTNRKAQAFRMAQLTYSGVTGDITVASGGTAAISAGVIVNADVNASAAIAGTKISPDFGSQTITTTGVVSAALGAAATPSLTFTGDLNTGIYSPGADQVAISTGGSGRLFVDASGDVGVGTSSPATLLDLSSATGSATPTPTELRITTTSIGSDWSTTNPWGRISFYNQDSSGGGPKIHASIATTAFTAVGGSSELTFSTTSNTADTLTERLRITSTGTVNIVGAGSAGSTQAVSFNGSAPVNSMVLDSSGRLGIGTSSPDSTLNVRAGANNTAAEEIASFSRPDAAVRAAITKGLISGTTNGIALGTTTNHPFALNTNGSERLYITNAGNVGIGTTSVTGKLSIDGSALNPISSLNTASNYAIALYGGSATGTGNGIAFCNDNGTSVGGAIVHIDQGSNNLGDLAFYTAATANSPSEKARLTASGQWLVGTSSARTGYSGNTPEVQIEAAKASDSVRFGLCNNSNGVQDSQILLAKTRGTSVGSNTVVQDGDTLGRIQFLGADGTDLEAAAQILAQVDGTPGNNDMPGRLVFSVTSDGASSPTERMRISNNGGIGAFMTDTGAYFRTSAATSSTTNTLAVAAGATNTTNGTNTFVVEARGNVYNQNNSYGSLSDLKLKENIVDANSQWDDLKALQVRNYNFKEGQTHTQIGLIAQEVELVSPGLVSESPDRDAEGNDLGTVTKSVNYSVLYMKAVKALQEAMERIETLEAKVAALESA